MSEKILFVDDDPNILSAFQRQLRKLLDMSFAESGPQALDLIEREGPFAVVVSDQRMPDMDGISFLKKVAEKQPHAMRIMLTGNADAQTATSAINESHVFRYLSKPCNSETVLAAVRDALAQYRVKEAERELLERTLAGSVKLLLDIISMQNGGINRDSARLRAWAKQLSEYGMEDISPWQLDLAVMLARLGEITLPGEVATKLSKGEVLTPEEAELVAHSPRAGRDLLRNIPRLSSVAQAIYYQNKGFDGSGFPDEKIEGADIPKLGRLLKILVDLSNASDSDVPSDKAMQALLSRSHLYDHDLLSKVIRIIGKPSDATVKMASLKAMDVDVVQLRENDKLLIDLITEQGAMILAAGEVLSKPMVQKIWQIHQLKKLKEPVRIERMV